MVTWVASKSASQAGISVNVLDGLRLNISDAVKMGPGILLRHFIRTNDDGIYPVKISGHDAVYVRDGDSDLDVIRQIFKQRQYELIPDVKRRALARYQQILESGRTPVIVDAGANIGASSIWFSDAYPDARIVAVEPEPGNLAVLRRNASRVTSIIHAAIGASSGFVSVKNNGQGWAAQTERSDKGIPIVTMAQSFQSVENGVPFIAKIDIEGFESDLFSRNLGWLDETFMVYVEPHDWLLQGQKTSRTFQRAFGDRDFDLFISGENLVYVRCAE